ncbi:MAG: histidinol-phosphate transaminase [Burkholderiaceae bacterium]
MSQPSATINRSLQHIRKDVQSMHAYAIQDSTGMVKLDAMENPYALPAALQAQLGEHLGKLAINRYPGSRVEDLKVALRSYAQVPAGYGLMLGNGSDELISLLAMACDSPAPAGSGKLSGGKILAPLPGFVMYAMSAQLQGLQFIGVALTADFELDEAAMLSAIDKEKPAVTYIAYPNNPTANLWDEGVIKKIIAATASYGGMVVMDEAYQPFSSKSWITHIHAAPEANANVLLMRTLSKFGLAGVRLGYMTGPAALIDEIDKLRPPYNISVLNCECALFALENKEVFAAQALEIRAQRAMLLEAIAKLPGAQPSKSDANMFLVRVQDAAKTFDELKQRGILVKNVSGMHPLLANTLRISVGTPEENQKLLAALQASI